MKIGIAVLSASVWLTLVRTAIDPHLWPYNLEAVVLAMVCGILAILGAILRKRWWPVLVWAIFFFAVLSSAWTGRAITTRQRETAFAAAQPLITAIVNFHTANGRYPSTVDELIPTYLDRKPHARLGFRDADFRMSSYDERAQVMLELPFRKLAIYSFEAMSWMVSGE